MYHANVMVTRPSVILRLVNAMIAGITLQVKEITIFLYLLSL